MPKLKTGESFEHNGYTITRLGAGKEGSKSNWALFKVASGDCAKNCEPAEGGSSMTCPPDSEGTCVNLWVKEGHCFGVGSKSCKLVESTRECSVLEEGSPEEAGICRHPEA